MVNPLLYLTLHTHLHQPVDVVCRCFIIRRAFHKFVYFFLAIPLLCVNPVHLHPCKELTVVDNVLFEGIANLVDEVYMYVCIIRINLTTTLIDRHEDWFDT